MHAAKKKERAESARRDSGSGSGSTPKEKSPYAVALGKVKEAAEYMCGRTDSDYVAGRLVHDVILFEKASGTYKSKESRRHTSDPHEQLRKIVSLTKKLKRKEIGVGIFMHTECTAGPRLTRLQYTFIVADQLDFLMEALPEDDKTSVFYGHDPYHIPIKVDLKDIMHIHGTEGMRRCAETLMYHMSNMSPRNNYEELRKFVRGPLRKICQKLYMTSAVLLACVVKYASPIVLLAIHANSRLLNVVPDAESGGAATQSLLTGMTRLELRLCKNDAARDANGNYVAPYPPRQSARYKSEEERSFWISNSDRSFTQSSWDQLEHWVDFHELVWSINGKIIDMFPDPTMTALLRHNPDMLLALKSCYSEHINVVTQVTWAPMALQNPWFRLGVELLAIITQNPSAAAEPYPDPRALALARCIAVMLVEYTIAFPLTGRALDGESDTGKTYLNTLFADYCDQEISDMSFVDGYECKFPAWTLLAAGPEFGGAIRKKVRRNHASELAREMVWAQYLDLPNQQMRSIKLYDSLNADADMPLGRQ